MRRRKPSRATTAALALLLFLGAQAAEVVGAHPCPRHHHDDASSATRPGTAGAAAWVSSPAGGEETTSGLTVCTCVGNCHGGAASPVPSDAVGPRVPLAPSPAVHGGRPSPDLRADRGAYFLPFPNGPPLA